MNCAPRFELVTTASGAVSIRDNRVHEIMHNPVGPAEEARALYVEPARLGERLTAGQGAQQGRALILFDVGLGAAANALAAISAAMAVEKAQRRQLVIISFENDLSLGEFTLTCGDRLPYLQARGPALAELLSSGAWKSPCGSVQWLLRTGNFLDCIVNESYVPDVVFFDPYSPTVNQEMWTRSAFGRLYRACDPSQKITQLLTYSVATSVRTALLLAGFYVGRGPATGLKKETTQASTSMQGLVSPLGERWLIRWLRSHAKLASEPSFDRGRLTHEVLCHPQFIELVHGALLPAWRTKNLARLPLRRAGEISPFCP